MLMSMSALRRSMDLGFAVMLALICWSGFGVRALNVSVPGPTPQVGDRAPDFALASIDGTTVRLSDEIARGPVVLVVLRGWPGYQCPFCTRQFGDYLANGANFEKSGARVLFVYPGPADGLKEHARAFTASRELPAAFRILVDPDYSFTQAYGLRWDAPGDRVPIDVCGRQTRNGHVRSIEPRPRG
jgi:thioredoxin-dependent peroxiredoxin